MRSDTDRAVTGYRPGSPRQRAISSVLSAGLILLVLLLAIYQTGVVPMLDKRSSNPVTFDVAGKDADQGAKSPDKQPEKRKQRKAKQEAVKETRVVPPVEQPVEKKPAFTFLKLSSADFAASDIGAMKPSQSDDAASGGGNGGSTYGPGEGPGGAILYNANWYREPSDAELGGYLPPNAPREGWGMIACQTKAHYKVDNCEILGESPRGSGFGRAVLDAAWQFQVVPPRINGKPQLGEWVRIRIEYGTRKAAG
ncbi:energy transducer TonB family protein [Novosphingobium mangrovi (ex Huang et al. 2023)]|uniref:Energy transducer TonB n=1 Tax=Novosphingobium mangrovi (ex Huang et al. 2023) TaxID=2976432 RepID=A0ABT2I6E7_9SPHN|nr:energy transducer TonB [Novosphingobium mangrovi (ex Huang et al. 2023)]MCT2400390.1 hypothetical protein [Novosphingobium mangrovi (ex Huang et al. 2023)]